jgi:SAM-dependent methyltransferase
VVRPRARRSASPLNRVAEAYSDGAEAWADGPARVYSRLAELLVDFSPVSLNGMTVLDLGSGTGHGSRAALAVGARVIAADLVVDMLRVAQADRPPAVSAHALELPFHRSSFDVVLAAFSLNHLDDPAEGIREAGRIGRRVLASTYATDDDHPAKGAVDTALNEMGWTRPGWYSRIKIAMAAWGTVADATAMIERGGLEPARVERLEVTYDDLEPRDLVAWRMGLAQSSAFVASLDHAARQRLTARALDLLGPDPGPLVRRVIFLAADAR